MRLLALAFVAISTSAGAKSIELDCTDPSRPDKPHWSVTLNEESGTGTVVAEGSGYTMANKPVAFAANEVRITTREERFGMGHLGSSIFSINRKTLAWKWTEQIDGREIGGTGSGQCQFAADPNRKF